MNLIKNKTSPKMKKNKILINEDNLIINKQGINVYKEKNNVLFFEAMHTPVSKYALNK